MNKDYAAKNKQPAQPPMITGVVLAGGNSRRMGFNKALLEVGGCRLVERVVHALREAFGRVMLVANEPADYLYLGMPVVSDIFPGRGPLSGIHAALVHAGTPYVFVAACDMPLADTRLARFLAGRAHGFDVVVVREGVYLEPMFAVYSRNCLTPVEALLRRDRARVTDFFPSVRVKYIERWELPPGIDFEGVFLNVNSPRDLERAADRIFRSRERGEEHPLKNR